MPVEPQKPYISSKEAARKFDLTNDHIGLLCRRGKIQGLLWGRVWYVSEPSLNEYFKKNSELKEARKLALSKQWRTAWTTAFVGFALYSLHTGSVSANFVTPSVALRPTPAPLALSVAQISAAVGEFENNLPMPQPLMLVANDPQPALQAKAGEGQTLSNIREGLFVVGEMTAGMFAADRAPQVQVVYAKDFESSQQYPEVSLADALASLTSSMSAAVASVPAPDLSFKASKPEPLFTAQNLLAGTAVANEAFASANSAMFASYADSVSQFVRYAQFDAAQAGYTFDQVFGEFGRQYVSDLTRLNDAQVHAYLAAGDAVYEIYNYVADELDAMPRLDSSISVASANFAAPDLSAAVGETVGSVWNGAVDWLSNIFVSLANSANQLVENNNVPPQTVSGSSSDDSAPAKLASENSSGRLSPQSLPVGFQNFPQQVSPSPGVSIAENQQAREGISTATSADPGKGELQPILQQLNGRTRVGLPGSELVTQASLNDQFAAWLVVVKALIAGDTGYVNNPAVAAGGNGGGGTVNNYYSYAQRIDKLDGVTLTNSSINGVSDFSHLGGGASALTDLSDTLVSAPSYGNLLMYNGSKWVNAATSSLGISGGTVTGSVGNWFAPSTFGTRASNATSTLIGFTQGLYSLASSTIGSGTEGGGLTVSGGATTTGNLHVLGTGTSTFVGNIAMSGNIVPTADQVYSLGSAVYAWKDLFVGPGSIYVNGQEVLHTDPSHNVDVSADPNQSIIVQTSGTGDVQLNPTGTGVIYLKGNVLFSGGKTFNTSDNSATTFTDGVTGGFLKISGNVITPTNLNGGISITPLGSGGTYFTSGNVGIGTTSPFAKLSVSGDAYISSNLTAAGAVVFSSLATGVLFSTNGVISSVSTSSLNISGGGASLVGSAGQVAYFSGSNTAVGTSSLYISTAGNVGVGTAGPSLPLDVQGTASVGIGYTNTSGHALIKVNGAVASQAGYYIYKNGVEKAQIAVLGGSNDLSFSMAGTDRLHVATGGNVGIGNTSPNYLLDVAGLGHFTGLVDAPNFVATSSSIASIFSGGFLSYASSTIGGGTQITGLTIAGGATTTGNSYTSGSVASANSFHTSGGVYVGGSSGFLQFGDLGIAGSITGALGIVSDGVFRFLDSSGGGSPRIILGSNSAAWVSLKRNGASLDVRLGDDSGYASTTASIFTAVSTARASTFPYASTTVASVSNSFYLNSLTSQNCLGTDSLGKVQAGTCSGSNLYASTTIGTGAQNGGLTVSGGATTTGDAYFAGNITGAGTATFGGSSFNIFSNGTLIAAPAASFGGPVFNFGNNAGNEVGAGSAYFAIQPASVNSNAYLLWAGVGISTKFAITGDGLVGIGTTTPSQALSVQGSGLFSGNLNAAGITATGTLKLLALTNQSCLGTDSLGNVQAGTCGGGNSFGYEFPNNATTTGLGIFASTTIGNGTQQGGLSVSGGATTTGNAYFANTLTIGATTPTTQFSVNGSSAGISLNRTGGSEPFIQFLFTGTSVAQIRGITGGGLRFTDSAATTEWARFTATGNFGIGTTSPYAALSVVGASGVVAGKYTATSTATSTFTGAIKASCFSTDGTTCITGGNSFGYDWTPGLFGATVANSTTTLIGFVNGIYALASSTIGNGTAAGGLTVSGNATTTGTAYFAGSVGIGTSLPQQAFDLASGIASFRSNASYIGFSGNNYFGGTTFFRSSAGANQAAQINGDSTASTATFFAIGGGNVGVGTTTPYAKLSVVGEIVGANLTATSTTATSTIAGGLNVGSGAITYDFSSGVTSINNAALGSFTFDTDAGVVSWADLPISSSATAGTAESYTANVGGSSVLTIYGEADGAGNAQNLRVGIGTTSPSVIGGVGGLLTLDRSNTQSYGLLSYASTTGSMVQFAFANANGVVGTISTNGSATAYNTSSDRRIKADIATTSLSLATLMQLPVREFSFIQDPAHATTTGFIAQELFKVFPFAVTTNGDDGQGALATGTLPWSVDYGRITPLIVKAVQDIADITSSFKDNLIAWLADAGNGITKLFAKEVHTDKLCVGVTCVTQEQFMAMVAASSQHSSAPTPSAQTVTPTPDASSTPEIIPDATSTDPLPPPAEEASSTPNVPAPDASSTPAE